MITITYIWHDCFLVKTGTANLIFDYWVDPMQKEGGKPSFFELIDPAKPLYVFVTHHHKDHFNKDIFNWETIFPNIRYILSNDVAKASRHILSETSVYSGYKPSPEKVSVLKRDGGFDDGIVEVKAFGSTDVGNSYWVECGGKSFFHAGDLNDWIWLDDSSDDEIRKMNGDFKAVLRELKDLYPAIDYAMFPVDSRIGREYWTGAKLFLESEDVKYFFPMHFGLGERDEQERYRIDAAKTWLYANPERGSVVCLQSPYSAFSEP